MRMIILIIIPVITLKRYKGVAIFISFFTPDIEVKVVAPVKFKAINEITGIYIQNPKSIFPKEDLLKKARITE